MELKTARELIQQEAGKRWPNDFYMLLKNWEENVFKRMSFEKDCLWLLSQLGISPDAIIKTK